MNAKQMYEWWSRTEPALLSKNEKLIGDSFAFRDDARPWEGKRGRLLLTTERLIFLPTLARILPSVPFAGSRIQVERRDILKVTKGSSHFGQLLKMSYSSSFVTLELRDGKKPKFYSQLAEPIELWASTP